MKKARSAPDDLPLATERGDDRDPSADQDDAGSAAQTDGDNEALEQLRSELATLNDRHLRLAAEFSNYRRRAETELTEAWGRAQADLLRRFLEVLDDLQRVSALDPSDGAVSVQSVVEGIDLVERKFARALEEANVEMVDPGPGDRFDPATMEAVMRVPADAPDQDDTVHQLFQKGYRFRNHLVRAARVSVRKHE